MCDSAARTTLGSVRGLPAALDQALSQYTSDNGDHVQLVMLRVAGAGTAVNTRRRHRAGRRRSTAPRVRRPRRDARRHRRFRVPGRDFPGDLHPTPACSRPASSSRRRWATPAVHALRARRAARAALQDARLAPRREASGRLAAGVLGLHEAGVSKVLADGGVGSPQPPARPARRRRPNDFIDLTIEQDIYVRRRPPAHHARPGLPDAAATAVSPARRRVLPAASSRAAPTSSPTARASSRSPRSTT